MSTEWFKNAVIYHILIDRFTGCRTDGWDKPDFLGGTIRGIIQKFDYIKNLGVNAIWISPFYKTTDYHGYHVTDFYQVDPRFGSLDDLKELIEKAHQAQMRIITDFVPNHVSDQHPYFLDARKRVDSPFYDWFYFNNWPDDYLCFLSIRSLPKLNLDNLPARKHILDAARFWLGLGFDGLRLDHCIGPSHKFWKLFRAEIKSHFPNCILIGEAALMGIKFKELKTLNFKHKYLHLFNIGTLDGMFREYVGELDGVLDFKFQSIVGDFTARRITKDEVQRQLQKHYKKYPPDFYLPAFLDSHDTDRILFRCGNDIELLKEAARILFSVPQPKIIYYGTESGLNQEKSLFDIPAYGDLQARKPMNWDNMNKDLLDFYKELIHNTALSL